jgi:serine/threonine protein kinase
MDFTVKDLVYKDHNKEICKVLYKDFIACAKIYDFSTVAKQFYPEQEFNILKVLGNFEKGLIIYGSTKYIDTLTKTKKFAILMEFCSHGNLIDYLKTRKKGNRFFNEIEIWNNIKGFTFILRYLQRKNICHRDIKPENILVTQEEKLKLADFGESKENGYGTIHTLTGTELYLSPKLAELYKKSVHAGRWLVDHNVYKSDVYSLGLVFLTMVSLGNFTKKENRNIEIEQKKENLKNPLLRKVLESMLQTEEENRPDFEELGQTVERVCQGQICFGCGEEIGGEKFECLHCTVSFHASCAFFQGKHICRACQNQLDGNIELLDPNEKLDLEYSVLNYCLFCKGVLIEYQNNVVCSECEKKVCKICKAGNSQHSKCITQEGFYFDCTCGNICFYDCSMLFFECPECGFICRVCFQQDTQRSHLSCANILNIQKKNN